MWHFAPMTRELSQDVRRLVPGPAAYIRLLLRRFGTTSELRAQLLAGTDIDEDRVHDPRSELTLHSFVSFGENLTRHIGEEWPLDAFKVWGSPSHGALEVAVRSAETVAHALEIVRQYGHVRGPYLRLGLKRSQRKTALTFGSEVALSFKALKALSETALFSAVAMLEPLLESSAAEIEIHFPWPEPQYTGRMRALVNQPIKFSQLHCAIVLANEVCTRPSPYTDQSLLATAVRDLERAAQRVQTPDNLLLRVDELFKSRRVGRISAEAAARTMGLSRRTLIRKLAAHGTSFRMLLDNHLKQRASEMMNEGKLSRIEMAEALGFQDATSFSRACRRWFSDNDAQPKIIGRKGIRRSYPGNS
jgi:AraC-like DNA-binding protein